MDFLGNGSQPMARWRRMNSATPGGADAESELAAWVELFTAEVI
jgi:hypothetical protein